MRIISKFISCAVFLAICLIHQGCTSKDNTWSGMEKLIILRDSIKKEYAPDGRVAIFNIYLRVKKGVLNISGETDQHRAFAVFINSLNAFDVSGMKVEENISLYPDISATEYPYAVTNNSVANLRSQPSHSAELASQALLGTELKVLKIEKEWYLVQSPDGYIAWVDHGGVTLKNNFEMQFWRETEKVIVTENFGYVYKSDSLNTRISDTVLGNILSVRDVLKNVYCVAFPDGRMGYVKKSETEDYKSWLESIKSSPRRLKYTARSLLGSPYLWGGTSAKGMDCSGFTKTVFFLNGLVIPRDASQQVNEGDVVDKALKFEGLEKGDLLFFGRVATDTTKQSVTHVGIWLGDSEFIHSSHKVRISSIDPKAYNYDEFNKNRYLGSRRYLNATSLGIVDLTKEVNQ